MSNSSRKLISVIVPVYNEEKNVQRAYDAIVKEFEKLKDLDCEMIFMDNHSKDRTFEILKEIAEKDKRVRIYRFARNFGFQRSILTGYRKARGDAAIQIDCDLQDPPSVFPEFIRLWLEGHDVVVGLRAQRPEHPFMLALRRFYYWMLNKISDVSDVPHEVDAGDFRLTDRRILDQLHTIHDAQPYVRGLISELSRNQTGVRYIRNKREFGESKFSFAQLIKMGLEGIFVYSTTPLRVATYLGILIALLTSIMIGVYAVLWIFFAKSWPPGFTTTTLLLLFGISLNAVFLGIIGEYLGRIYNQIRGRPVVVIEKEINVESSNRVQQSIGTAVSRNHGL
ncbi:MAG TPA: glycosyltransferase family 2 protein [Chlamydiales bacterium]|nr:glycosyltransferase family 2 protein [Chlamydiales bacterium]